MSHSTMNAVHSEIIFDEGDEVVDAYMSAELGEYMESARSQHMHRNALSVAW